MKIFLFFITSCLLLAFCKKEINSEPAQLESESLSGSNALDTRIMIISAEEKIFVQQLLLPGLIRSYHKVIIKSESSGQVNLLNALDGKKLTKGQTLLDLDDRSLSLERNRLISDYEKAKLDRDERIMLVGGEFGKDSSISAEQLNYIDIKSGVRSIKRQIEELDYRQSRMKILAPFSGIVADTKVKNHQQINSGEIICTLIDPASYEVEFQIIESMLGRLRLGAELRFHLLEQNEQWQKARINAINPQVDDNGLITIRASVLTNRSEIMDGMHVRVSLDQRSKQPMIVVPKQALVLRSGKEVVFSYDPKTEKAKWNYVKVGLINENEIALTEGLAKNALVIVSGNLNLEHDARVLIDSTSTVKIAQNE